MNASDIVLAASGGRGFHAGGGFGILIVLVIAALGFGFVRLRNRKDAQIRDDEWRRSLGPNGAGKTTLIRTLLGLTRANSGTMSLLGVPVPAERRRALARVGAIVDEPRFHAHLTGRENLRLLAAARGDEAGTRISPSLARAGLADRADDKVGSYSMGMRQRLGVAAHLGDDRRHRGLDRRLVGAWRMMTRDA
jgi:ABC-type Na+ transport system ATPase subunit NatA